MKVWKVWIIKFADDTKKYFANFQKFKIVRIYKRIWHHCKNGHRIGKCSLILTSVRSCTLEDTIHTMMNKQLERVNEEKDLGVFISDGLKPSAVSTVYLQLY